MPFQLNMFSLFNSLSRLSRLAGNQCDSQRVRGMSFQVCRLCSRSSRLRRVHGADERVYYLCEHCMLVFAAKSHFMSFEEERARYETHNNNIENEGYVKFLNRIVDPMLEFVQPGMRGLDYGCGPGPVLSTLVRRAGMECDDYDPIFYPNSLRQQYDFILCTETFEHFFYPVHEIEKLSSMLPTGGYIGVMTGMWNSIKQFETWYYTRDPTHVSFYHRDTFEYICRTFGFEPKYSDDRRVIILQKE